jgi:hypothetical protein
MLDRKLAAGALAVALVLTGCSDRKKKAEQLQLALEAEKAAKKAADEAKEQPAPTKVESAHLEAFWDDSSHIKVSADAACPEGMWALFPGDAPGTDPAEKKANGARRGELAKKLREATFVAKLRAPSGVVLKEYDAPKGYFPLEVLGTIDCVDSGGHIAIAWSPAKAVAPGNSAAKEGAEVSQNMWQAEPFHYTLPMKSVGEAKEWRTKHQFDLDTRIVFKLGKVQVDKKLFKTSKVTSGEITLGGGMEDWGAGRMVVAEVEGVRVATDHEKTAIIEKKGKK